MIRRRRPEAAGAQMTQETTIEEATGAVAWAEPHYARLWWTWDQMHFPRPSTPYTASIECHAMSRGSSAGFQSLGARVSMVLTQIDGYMYEAVDIIDPNFDEWMPEAQANIVPALTGLLDRWRDEYLPEVMAINTRLRDFDYDAATAAELIAMIDESIAARERQWDIHMRVVVPVTFVASELRRQWDAAFGPERADEPLTLMQGFANKTIEAGAELWKLSREALAAPAVAQVIAETPLRRIVPLLGTTDDGRAFLRRLDAYLFEYGWRSGGFEYADAPWIEDPCVALSTLRDYMRQPDGADPSLVTARAAAEREALYARVAPEIDALPQGPILKMMVEFAGQYLPIQEDHNFYIDQMNTVLMRKPALAAGRRLATADALAMPEDVFFLAHEEVKDALRDPAARDWAELVAGRSAEHQRRCETTPPLNAGTPIEQTVGDEPAMGAFSEFFGRPVVQDASSNVLVGTAASRRAITGTARVIRRLEESDRLQPGEILVCEMTMPAWTPLFAIASAVVTDSGGVLSHSAIVAREYGIPCVVGTTSGTRRIADGQRITVDGAAGTVTLEGD
jgi:pyruvate,water dikinase